jgi:hypothetical protein
VEEVEDDLVRRPLVYCLDGPGPGHGPVPGEALLKPLDREPAELPDRQPAVQVGAGG